MALFFTGLILGVIIGILIATWALVPNEGGFE
jgi:hypothetical protein